MIPLGLISHSLLQKIMSLKGTSKSIFKSFFFQSHFFFFLSYESYNSLMCHMRLLKYMFLLQLRCAGRNTCLGITIAPCSDVPVISMQALHPDFLVYLAVHYLRPACQSRLNILWEIWSHL